MATHDYVLDNATGANFRSDLNNALAAIVSNNSSSTEPSTKYSYQWWADTNEGVLKIRNSSNDGWVTLLQLDGTLTLEDGSASAPALGFRDDLNTGIFSSAADTVDVTCGGTTRGSFSSSGLTVTGTCSATTLTGTLSTAAQTNVTSLGTLTGLTLSGDMTFTGDSANVQFDKSDSALEFLDNAKAKFGTGDDLAIYHNGTHSFITDSGTGNLHIDSSQILFRNAAGSETLAVFAENGAIELYHNDSKKFETLSDGVRITSADDSSGGVRGDFLFQQTDGTTVATFDASASSLKFEDNRKAVFGAGSDLEIYHSGSHSFIKDTGTGQLVLNTDAFRLNNAADGENLLTADENGAVNLFFDDSKKLETTSGGVTITGDLSVTDDVTITDDLFVNDNINLLNNGKLKVGTGEDLQIYHDGSNTYIDNHTGDLFIRGQDDDIILQPVDGEDSVKAIPNGAVELYYDNSKKFETTNTGISVTGKAAFPDGNSNGIVIGDSEDLRIFHNGSHSYVENVTGNLNLTSTSSVQLLVNNTENAVTCNVNGAVELFHNNSKKLETLSDGVDVTGTLKVNGSAIGTGGKVLQVVQSYKTDVFTSSAQNSFTDITGLSVSITPSSSSNKVLIIANVEGSSPDELVVLRLLRGSTVIGASGVGDTYNGFGMMDGEAYGGNVNRTNEDMNTTFLDSPSTTSSTTYKIQFLKNGSGTFAINRRKLNAGVGFTSAITVMEIGA